MYGICKDCDACGEPIYIWYYDDGSVEGVYSALEVRGGVSTWDHWERHAKAEPDCEYDYQHGGEA
tara:strand:- start:45 stop:239 length:195 start_codon:yes stop_codon:yes gene_type:complete